MRGKYLRENFRQDFFQFCHQCGDGPTTRPEDADPAALSPAAGHTCQLAARLGSWAAELGLDADGRLAGRSSHNWPNMPARAPARGRHQEPDRSAIHGRGLQFVAAALQNGRGEEFYAHG